MRHKLIILLLIIVIINIFSCKKFLNVKPSTSYTTVSSVSDTQQLLDNATNMNTSALYYGEWSSDNYYFPQALYDANGLSSTSISDIYIWGRNPFKDGDSNSSAWAIIYQSIMVCNVALDALKNMNVPPDENIAANTAHGCALAFRGYFFWKLATTFSKSYNKSSAGIDLGIPLRLNVDINEKSTRASVQQTYDQIIKDLNTSLLYLPNQQAYITRPSKPSVYAMLSEVYLSMRNYERAKAYADSSLSSHNGIVDFNSLDKNAIAPLPLFNSNKELLLSFGSYCLPWFNGSGTYAVDTSLLASYKSNDLRKLFYYTDNGDGTFYYSGSISPNGFQETGPTTVEMYLTRAECLARSGNITDAMSDLNTVMINRIDHSTKPYVPFTATTVEEALQTILRERRKELAFRDLRWMDIKRLNLEGANIVLTRDISGKIYTLLPNANRYAIPLPDQVVQFSGVSQNPY